MSSGRTSSVPDLPWHLASMPSGRNAHRHHGHKMGGHPATLSCARFLKAVDSMDGKRISRVRERGTRHFDRLVGTLLQFANRAAGASGRLPTIVSSLLPEPYLRPNALLGMNNCNYNERESIKRELTLQASKRREQTACRMRFVLIAICAGMCRRVC